MQPLDIWAPPLILRLEKASAQLCTGTSARKKLWQSGVDYVHLISLRACRSSQPLSRLCTIHDDGGNFEATFLCPVPAATDWSNIHLIHAFAKLVCHLTQHVIPPSCCVSRHSQLMKSASSSEHKTLTSPMSVRSKTASRIMYSMRRSFSYSTSLQKQRQPDLSVSICCLYCYTYNQFHFVCFRVAECILRLKKATPILHPISNSQAHLLRVLHILRPTNK